VHKSYHGFMITHLTLSIEAKSYGCHLITEEILNNITLPSEGILHLFIQHTSAAICIQENSSKEVRDDLSAAMNRIVPENPALYTHTEEGPDDMPAHVKSSLIGTSLSIPIHKGQLMLGVWQGIYLLEFRHRAGARKIVVSLYT
jgi:secondary thiamine-phosphate synthase enzyme